VNTSIVGPGEPGPHTSGHQLVAYWFVGRPTGRGNDGRRKRELGTLPFVPARRTLFDGNVSEELNCGTRGKVGR
jgi:hypothetical protein